MIIDITLNDFKEITANSDAIGKTFENKAVVLCFHLTEKMISKDIYLDIAKPDGTKFRTQKLVVEDNKINYQVPNSILDVSGFMKIEVILQKDDVVEKYPSLNFKIEDAINAIETLPEDNPTLVKQMQELIDMIDTTGKGIKYLSDDGTYKEVSGGSGGTADYDNLENKPITRLVSMDENKPIVLRNLDSGIYCLHGYILPYVSSTDLFAAQTPISVNVAKASDLSFIQLFFSFNNQLQYFEISDNNYTFKEISLSELVTKEYIDSLVGAINTELATLTTISEVSK